VVIAQHLDGDIFAFLDLFNGGFDGIIELEFEYRRLELLLALARGNKHDIGVATAGRQFARKDAVIAGGVAGM
jgi:hypothetical protein